MKAIKPITAKKPNTVSTLVMSLKLPQVTEAARCVPGDLYQSY